MQIIINKLKIDYLEVGKGPTLVFLHGWGPDKEKYIDLINLLSKKFRVIALDFPGFGKSSLPPKAWTNKDYAQFLDAFLTSLNISKYILIGHSFGGRIILKYSSNNPQKIKKIILINSSGIERKSLIVKAHTIISNFLPKSIKKILLPFFGSADYVNSQGVMRETFKKVINENFEAEIAKIKIPTLLIWGQEDHTTPLWQGKLIHKLISDSTLIVVPGANHGLPYRQAQTTAEIIKKSLK
ncbi:MAG: alpha/beta hydrolase [Candidatus Shapirobacteria bacterium]